MGIKGTKISLVFPSYKKFEDPVSLKEAKEHLGAIPPLSLAYVASILQVHGCSVQIVDASALRLNMKEAFEKIRRFSPDFLGFTSTTVDFQNTLAWAAYLKQALGGLPVVMGGIHLSVYPQETLSHPAIDYGIMGDAEDTVPELLDALAVGGGLDQVKGICYRKEGRVIQNEKRPFFKDIDASPFPARDLLQNEKYYSFISRRKNFTAMITSRGCPFRCIFCDNQTIPYRFRSPKNIVDEMEQCKKEFRINEIDIFDALFSIDKQRVTEICREIRKRNLKIDWSFRTRVDLVSDDKLRELKAAGCIRIYYGIESGDPGILRTINKNIELDLIRRVVCLTKKHGIDTFGYFMIGNIGETSGTVKKSLELMRRLPLDYVQISPVFAPPNTRLYEFVKQKEKRDYWKEYTLGSKNNAPLSRFGTDLTDLQIKRYIRECYFAFYLRPSYILRQLIKLNSFKLIIRYSRAVMQMLFSYARHIGDQNSL